MSLPAEHRRTRINGFPRVSGDEPSAKTWMDMVKAFSPRERG